LIGDTPSDPEASGRTTRRPAAARKALVAVCLYLTPCTWNLSPAFFVKPLSAHFLAALSRKPLLRKAFRPYNYLLTSE